MKVVHYVDRFSELSETFIRNLVTGHQSAQATVLTHAVLNLDQHTFRKIECVPRAQSKRSLAWWRDRVVEALSGAPPWSGAAARALRAHRPQLIHAHFGNMGYDALPIAHALGIPLVVSFYGYDASVLPHRPGWRAKLETLFAKAAAVVAEGPVMGRELIALGSRPDRTHIVPIMIHTDRYPKWAPNKSMKSVLFAGRFVEKKGPLHALEAFRRIAGDHPDAHLRLVGDGPLRGAVEEFVRAHGLTSRVALLGMQPHHVLIEELARAQVLIQPSIRAANGDSEGGAPTILLEAQAVGTPIVTTRHADIPNVVDGGAAGVHLADEGDVSALSEGLIRALKLDVGIDGAFVVENHDVKRAMPRLESIYGRLV